MYVRWLPFFPLVVVERAGAATRATNATTAAATATGERRRDGASGDATLQTRARASTHTWGIAISIASLLHCPHTRATTRANNAQPTLLHGTIERQRTFSGFSFCVESFPFTSTMSGIRRLIPLLDRVLVERIVAPTKSAGGVLLPESAMPKVSEKERGEKQWCGGVCRARELRLLHRTRLPTAQPLPRGYFVGVNEIRPPGGAPLCTRAHLPNKA